MGIHAVGLGQLARGAPEVTGLARVDHGDRQTGRLQGQGQGPLQASGRFHHNAVGSQPGQAPAESLNALPVVGQAVILCGATPERHIELVLGYVDADMGLGHGLALR